MTPDMTLLEAVETQLSNEAAQRIKTHDTSHVVEVQSMIPHWDRVTAMPTCLLIAEAYGMRAAIRSALSIGFEIGARYGETSAMKAMLEGK